MLDVTLAAPQRHDVLTIFPLVTPTAAELPYALLADALEANTFEIAEVGTGTVPRLLARNRGDADVLILDGEQLIGAKQNRMTNRTIVLPARSETEIPVSCMERGRWRFDGDGVKPAPQHSPANVRRHARVHEAAYALRDLPAPEAALAHAQHGVWDEIADYEERLGVRSETGALDALYDGLAGDLEAWAASFPCGRDQVGLLAFVGGRPIGLDVVGGRGLYARLHDRLLRGYILDALAARMREPVEGGVMDAQRFLDRVRGARRVAAPTVGRGVYRVLAGAAIGGELEDGGRLVHLCGFPADDDGGRGARREEDLAAPPLPPPSRRRQLY